MKLITLNTWAGREKAAFDAFLKEHMVETDIFCFQEIFNNYDGATGDYINHDEGNGNILQEITDILADFDQYFCPIAENVFGIAIFLKKGIGLIASGELVMYENPDFDPHDKTSDHTRKMQWMHIQHGRKDVMIMNVHGHWDARGRDDTPNRLQQSKILNDFIESVGLTPKIMVGDFNLNAQTESIKLLEKNFTNLISKYGVTSTRTPLYTGDDQHSDYVFVSPEVLVEDFKVMPDVVSDHAPLYLQFDVF
ncbi:MAG: Endonuclease [Candidatus Nomurabacteria bacterium]|jgi:endonuclease/exonuclease/phosphatase family metal-dependent hydrolase|nr:Endonuclease [Candidatus Nomurabacteria bacterium]